MTSVELPVRFEEPDEVMESSEKGSSSKGSSLSDGPATPHTNDNSTGSPNSPSSSSTSSSGSTEDSYIIDTDVFLPTESVQGMAETVGVELDEESAAILSQTVVNKLRHLTLLAMQFSRHGRSKGLRVEDFSKAEKIVDSTASLGYGFSHKLPEYLDLGQVTVEWEGGDFDLSTIIRKPAVDEIAVDGTVEPVLISGCINYHDKMSRDYDEGVLCPDFKDMFKNWAFNQDSPTSSFGYGHRPSEVNQMSQMNGGRINEMNSYGHGFHHDNAGGSKLGTSSWNGDMKESELYEVSVQECGDISIQNLRTESVTKVPGPSNQGRWVEKMSLHSGGAEGNDVMLAPVHVPKRVKAESGDDSYGLEPMEVTESDNQDSVVIKFEPAELGDVSVVFNENVFIKDEKYGREEPVVQLSIKQGPDFYKSGQFLYHQDVLGDDIFSEEASGDDKVDDDKNELNSRNSFNLDKEHTDLIVQNQETSQISQEEGSNTSAITFNGTEMDASDDSSPPANEESMDVKDEASKGTNCEDERESEDSEEDSEESDEEQEVRGSHYDDDFEIIIEPDSPEIEVSDSDEDDNPSDDEEEKINAKLTGDVPVEWGHYLQSFIVAFYDKEKPYETFEKVSFTFFPYEDEDEDDLPILDNYQLLLKDIGQHGVFPVLHIICELFHNFVYGLYEHMGSKQLRRITAFVDTTLSCPVQSKTYHLKPMLAILMDMLVLPVPTKLQSYVTTSILKVADYCEHPFNLELVTWITRFIIGVLESSSKLSLPQLTPPIKSRICAAIYLALGYDLRGLRLQRMHQWMKYVIMISNNHYAVHQKPHSSSNLRIECDSSDSYLEEAILRFIRIYVKHYHNDCPDESFKPLLQRAMDNYGEKLSIQLCNYKYFDVSTNDLRRRNSRWQQKNTEECNNESDNKVVNEFLMRPGWVQCKELTKVKIPFAMCVL